MKTATSIARRSVVYLALLTVPSVASASTGCGTPVGTPGLSDICTNGGGGLSGLINGIANWLTGLIGLVVVLIIIIAGVQMIASAGNPEAIKAARGRLTNAIIGLVTLLSMRLILTLIGVIK